MNSLASSIASIAESACATCGAEARVNGGSCVSCLLRTGLGPPPPGYGAASETSDGQSFDDVLREIEVRDTDWRLGNYQILEEIGRGGMGVIYRARQRHSKRIVALKRVLSYHGDSRETLERFRREAEAAASLDHPNILPIYEVSESEGLPFFTMKYATGGSLQQAAPALSADPRECVRLLAKIARAVAYAHREGILHRDLKPGNILLDARGEPMVSDFGLAKWIDANTDLTRSLTIFGTPGYIAPEQAEGPAAALTPAADVYSLGAILFDLLTGRPPFLGEHALAVIRQAAEKPAPKLRSLIRKADRDLETISAKCLEREPRTRYRSASDLAEDLERWLEGRTIVARPVGTPVRLLRWTQRNPILAAAVAACLVAGGIAVSRQIKNYQLAKTVEQQLVSQHSVEVVSFFDLGRAESDDALSAQLGKELQRRIAAIGPGKITLRSLGAIGAGIRLPLTLPATNPDARGMLLGTIRRVGEKTRLSLRLLDGRNGETRLHRAFSFDSSIPLASRVSADLAADVYSQLDMPTRSAYGTATDVGMTRVGARELIIAGRELVNGRGEADLDRAINCFRRAIEIEPLSSVAHTCLAMALTRYAAYDVKGHVLAEAEREARQALALNDDNSEAHRMLAGAFYFQGHFADALEEIHRAFECSVVDSRGASLAGLIVKTLGRPDRALTWLEIAKTDEAHPAEHDAAIGDCWAELGDDERAEQAYQRYGELRPQHPEGWMGLCRLRLLQGKFDEAKALLSQNETRYRDFTYSREMAAQVAFFTRDFGEAEKLYAQLLETNETGGGDFHGAMSYDSALGRLRSSATDDRGRKLLLSVKERESKNATLLPDNPDVLYRLAAIEASLGEREAALEHLRSSSATGWINYRSLEIDPRFDSVRKMAGYQDLLRKMTTDVASLRAATLQQKAEIQ